MSYDVAYLYGLENIDAGIAEVAFLSFIAGASLHKKDTESEKTHTQSAYVFGKVCLIPET